jgi:hypothetical protein
LRGGLAGEWDRIAAPVARTAIASPARQNGRTTPPRLHDAEADGWEAEYDPVKHRQEMARKQIGESRTPDSLAWR